MSRPMLYALGSPFGIDRLAWSVAQFLAHAGSGVAGGIDATQCLSDCSALLREWHQRPRPEAVVIDTLIAPDLPAFALRPIPREQLAGQTPVSGHGLQLADTLALAATLGLRPPGLTIYGLCVPDPELAHPGEAVVGRIAAALVERLASSASKRMAVH